MNNLLESLITEFKAYKKEVTDRLLKIETSLEVLAIEVRSIKENFPKDKKQKEKEIMEKPPAEIKRSISYETNSPKDYFIKYELPRIILEEEKYLHQLKRKVKGKDIETDNIKPEESTSHSTESPK